jgi:glycosyltransferase involved in cell wall biosynthesis
MTARPARPRVTIVVIFLNGASYLAEALDSALAQTFQDFEIILVDDGSSDGSTELAQGYAHRHSDKVRYLEHPGHVNRGMSASRNAGAAAGRGDLIAFLDADDVWEPCKLAEQVGLFDAHPKADLAAGAELEWRSWQGGLDERLSTGFVRDRVLEGGEATRTVYPLGQAKAPCPSNFMVRRVLFDAVGGFEESFRGPMQMYEDQAFLSKAYLAGRPYFCDRLWVKYRIHDQSCMAMYKSDHYDQTRQRFLQWLRAYLKVTHPRSPRIWMALWRAELPYRNPTLDALVQRALVQKAFVRRLYHGLGRRVRKLRRAASAGTSRHAE